MNYIGNMCIYNIDQKFKSAWTTMGNGVDGAGREEEGMENKPVVESGRHVVENDRVRKKILERKAKWLRVAAPS